MDSFYDKQRSYLKKISNSFINFKKEGAAKMNRGACKVRMEVIDNYWQKIMQNHDHILESEYSDPNHEYFVSDFYDKAEEIYLQRKGEFEEFLINLTSGHLTTERDRAESFPNNAADQLVKLPLPELPKFSGNFREWETFRDLMKSMVIDRRDLSNVAKFQYLKGSLSGEASDLIRTIPITEENFVLAWHSLQTYYENTRRLINAHIATLIDLKPMQRESTSELRRIYSGTVNPLLALEALQRPVSHWDDLIVFLTERKLDAETRRSWEVKLEDCSDQQGYHDRMNFPLISETMVGCEPCIFIVAYLEMLLNNKQRNAIF
ncbi:hypothetical protein J437_LFUL008937 [Ladona fulva]|uniref:Uncharacterized protein n=1 Tax=Ladona fulva TaxID=123851 RepID=A0A8K0KFC3_LADFU|nr:hypothetical protein J437_LFUL008937 [Ladona fulva]